MKAFLVIMLKKQLLGLQLKINIIPNYGRASCKNIVHLFKQML